MSRPARLPGVLHGAGLFILLVTWATVLSSASEAQVALQQVQPAPLPSDGFALSRPVQLDAHSWSAYASIDYANDPLVYRVDRGPGVRQTVVSDHVTVQLGAAYALHRRVLLALNIPVHALMRGDDDLLIAGTSPDGASLGDVSLAARVALFGGASDRFALAGELVARLPTAELARSSQRYAGDEIGSYEGALISELRAGILAWRFRLGVRLRKQVELQNLELGQSLLFATGLRVALPHGFSLHGELLGSTYLPNAFEQHHTPLELLLGPKYEGETVWLGVAAGPGLVDGYGSPDFRVMVTGGAARLRKQPPRGAPARAVADRDHDGLADDRDRCPDEPGAHDGGASDGCPLRDGDDDGLDDSLDACPAEAEDRDGHRDEDGCPDRDHDGDGVLEPEDVCPDIAGEANTRGCPAPEAPEPTDLNVEFGRVEFASGKDKSLAASAPTLQAVVKIMADYPQIAQVRVEGHADDAGDAQHNQELSKRRAMGVARWLVQRGVAAGRLAPVACGQRHPLVPERAEEARQHNRRVEFHVSDPAPRDPVDRSDCEALRLD